MQLPGTATHDSHMVMHTTMSNTYISLVRVFQKYISEPTRAHLLIDNIKDRKQASKRKWTEHDYYIQDRKYVQQKYVKMSCESTQF